MRKSTKPVLQTSMFLSAFSHRGSLRAQGIGKGVGGGGEGVRTHPAHARVFFLFHVPFKRHPVSGFRSVQRREKSGRAAKTPATHATLPPTPEGWAQCLHTVTTFARTKERKGNNYVLRYVN